METSRRILSKMHLVLSLIPWVTLAYFTVYAYSARFLLGHWPGGYAEENRPDALPNTVLQLFNWGGAFMEAALTFSVLAWLMLFIARHGLRCGGRSGFLRAGIIYGLGFFALWTTGKADPVGFVNWWWD